MLAPDLQGNPLLGEAPPWLEQTYADYFTEIRVRDPGVCVHEWMQGEGRAAGIDTAFPIQVRLREGDPNVDKPPSDDDPDPGADGGYIPPYSELSEQFDLERFAAHNHLGGTMFPQQGCPHFGPFYLEIEEDFGGFNFGSGNAQIDLYQMQLDWSC